MTRAWSGRSHGGGFGHALVHGFARFGGVTLCYVLLLPPTLWFFLHDHAARRASIRYWLRLRPGLARYGATVMAFRHFYAFARILADRFLSSVDARAIRFSNPGAERLDRAMAHPQGCILLSAHIGAWEMAGRWLRVHGSRVIHIVMLKAEDPEVQRELDRAMGDHPFSIIDLRDPFGASLEIAAALRRGETCCMLADRTAGAHANTMMVPFLGGRAHFPTGPFIAAATTGAVLVPTFALKHGLNRYVLDADEPWRVHFTSRASRQGELRAAVERWATRLETVVRRHPLQWQNFYDFWRA
jgi:predicted LPLAT superfamily acyltransferase